MKKSFFIISMVVMLAAVAVFANVSPVSAKTIDPDPLGCEMAGGSWEETGDGNATCVFSPDHFYARMVCGVGQSLVDYWKYDLGWYYLGSECKTGYSTTSQMNTEVTFGKPVDAWNGNCGAYISNPPLSGTVTISKVTMPEGPNRQTLCKVNYTDFQGNSMANFGSPGWVYYNLNAETAALWNKGQLNIYIYQNDAWQVCSNPILVDAGEYGRLACYAENPVYFGIGTAINDTNSTRQIFWMN